MEQTSAIRYQPPAIRHMERIPLWLYLLLLFAVGALYAAAFNVALHLADLSLPCPGVAVRTA